ncbi:MAG: hypothetical protein L0387_35595 [Acidobacteria bacterium]|nr:hypothetical protein [Acidobacteriota bacterium]MCI0723622.1 hypothetical protein [Acidobacteriota bacterium]
MRIVREVTTPAVFLTFLAIGVWGLNAWLDHVIEDEYEKTFREMYLGSAEYDVIFLGSSHTAHGIHPRYIEERTGLSVYNFAFDGANPPVMHSIYKFILKPRKRRLSIVVLDTIWFLLDEDWMPRTFYFNAEFIDWRTLLQYTFSDEVRPPGYAPEPRRSDLRNLLEYKIPLLKYHARLPEILLRKNFFERFDTTKVVDKNNYYRGYIPFVGGWVPGAHGWQYWRGGVSYRPAHINQEWVQVYDNTIRELQADGVRVLLYQAPEYLEAREVPNYDEVDAVYRRLAAKYHVPFLNYNTDLRFFINYDKKYFWNFDHLNREGSVIFSQKFAKDLERTLQNRKE